MRSKLIKLVVSGSVLFAASASAAPLIAQVRPLNTTTPANQHLQEFRRQIEERRNEMQQRFQAVLEESRRRVLEKREELKKKLQIIKDERKRNIALRTDERLAGLNERWTTHFMNVLEQLNNVLGRVQSRIEKADARGLDTTAAKAALQRARNAISTARQAVEEQAKKTYAITFSNENNLKGAVREARQKLHSDLVALRDGAMRNAREAVHEAIKTLRNIPNIDKEPKQGQNATSTQ
jgi:hypothetical protein